MVEEVGRGLLSDGFGEGVRFPFVVNDNLLSNELAEGNAMNNLP